MNPPYLLSAIKHIDTETDNVFRYLTYQRGRGHPTDVIQRIWPKFHFKVSR